MRALAIAAIVALASGVAVADRDVARRLYDEGVAAAARDNRARALSRFEAAITADPDLRLAYDAAIPLWIELDKLSSLVRFLDSAVERSPDYAFAHYALAFAHRIEQRYELAIAAYERYQALRPGDPDTHYGLGLALLGRGNTPRAIKELRAYVLAERRPERASWVADARERLESLGAPTPPPPAKEAIAARLARAAQLIDEMRFASALAVLDAIEPADRASRGELWLLRARANVGAGRPDTAIAAGFVALGLRSGDDAVLDALADAFAAAGRGAVAEYLRKVASSY